MSDLVTIVGQGLYLALAAVIGLGIARILRIDNTLGCLVAGVLAALLLPVIEYDTGVRATSLRDLVFFVILPVLIFESAWQLDPKALKRWIGPILLFSTLGLVVCAFLIATITYYGIGHPQGFPWTAALLTGAILAATDPVSVVNLLRRAHSGKDLVTLVEGESLFNDAAAVVFYSLMLGLATYSLMEGGSEAPSLSAGSVALYFCMIFFGGVACGLVFGLVTSLVILFLRSPSAALMTLVIAAFGSFYLAESVFKVSGIISVMICAIVARSCLRKQSKTYLADAEPTWEWLGLLFTAIIFVIMGLVITFEMFTHQWLAMLIATAAALGSRALSVVLVAPLTRFVGPPIPKSWRLLMSWGGLHSVIAVALVLSLPVELPYWWTIQSMVFGVVLFSLLVQGTTSARLIRKLQL
ncbi:sodium:proton antiporter [Microbulbifer sp. 2205BS26-8]|uniref:cation:proton antiporter n=1 Tax=Microbulbifer sp. 2205BS26-8 TaxID=3064386 RepID=UPI00273D6EB4|nr:sodium:proton antiporter [Microbulbifer sp. 2205BS26-8]MDP5208351.1 sodium:proton antiporter [Microbulbifer sp. 2205BS26-8]